MVLEQEYGWGRAYRGGRLVCARVHVTIGRDYRLGLTSSKRNHDIVVRFAERLDPSLRSELYSLVRRRGSAAKRLAKALEPLDIVVEDAHRGCRRITARIRPPQRRTDELPEVEFALREVPDPQGQA